MAKKKKQPAAPENLINFDALAAVNKNLLAFRSNADIVHFYRFAYENHLRFEVFELLARTLIEKRILKAKAKA